MISTPDYMKQGFRSIMRLYFLLLFYNLSNLFKNTIPFVILSFWFFYCSPFLISIIAITFVSFISFIAILFFILLKNNIISSLLLFRSFWLLMFAFPPNYFYSYLNCDKYWNLISVLMNYCEPHLCYSLSSNIWSHFWHFLFSTESLRL